MRVQIANKTMFNNALSTLFPQHNFSEVNGFTLDSRLVEKGDVYLPLKGKNVDGHNFISNAISNGASLIFSEQSSTEKFDGLTLINFGVTFVYFATCVANFVSLFFSSI